MKLPEYFPPIKAYKYLVPRQYISLTILYLQWLKLLSLRGLHLKKMTEKEYGYLHQAIQKKWSEQCLLGKLQKEFIKENLSLSMLLEPLDGFYWLSRNLYPLPLSASSPIILQIVAPVARFVAVLNNQHPPVYQPLTNLISMYILLYLQDMPKIKDILHKNRINFDNNTIQEITSLQYEEAKQILKVCQGLKFKFIMACYLGLYQRIKAKKMQKSVVFWDYVNAFLYGLWYMFTIKGKSIK